MSKKEIILLIIIAVVFLGLRLPGLHIPYHQDEYKWVYYSHPEIVEPGTVPHPPLTEFLYTKVGPMVGDNNFRLVPLAFGLVNLFLLFYLVKTIFDKKTAFWAVSLFTISFYSVLSNLMVDVDGAVMPFFLLLLSIGYFKYKEGNPKWLFLFFAGAIGGFLIKVSFAVCLLAFALDFAIGKGAFQDKKKLFRYALLAVGGILALVVILVGVKFIFPFFNLQNALKYWEHFVVFAGRGWLQTFIQFAKSMLYTSPLLLLPLLFINKETFQKTRPFFLFLFLGLFFYLFAFDFSLGALDRYFQFLIIPLCIIAGAVFVRNVRGEKKDILFISITSAAIFALQFFNQFVPALYPKTEWLSRVLHLKWQFLFPFTGGSGPTGFYVSFLFLALIWLVGAVFGLTHLKMKEAKQRALFCILVLGLLYNGVFIEEYLLGKINGSPYQLFANAKEYIAQNKNIEKVVVYNDIGGYEIQQIGKYERRMYAAPQFEATYQKFFKDWYGNILFIDIPRIDQSSFYWKVLSSCTILKEERDKYISALVLDCKK